MRFLKVSIAAVAFFVVQSAMADLGGQVFYQYGVANLSKDRGSQVFTDTNGQSGHLNDGKSGWDMGAGLDLPLLKGVGPGDILGQVFVDYAHYSKKQVVQTSGALLGQTNLREVTVSTLNVAISPKYRFESFLGGKVTPWIIPIGLSFLVNSPPSDNTSYLDIGYHLGAGIEYKVIDALSVGLSYRMTLAAKEIDVDNTNSTYDLYVGVNF